MRRGESFASTRIILLNSEYSLEYVEQLTAHKVQIVCAGQQNDAGQSIVHALQELTHAHVVLADLHECRLWHTILMLQSANALRNLLEAIGQAPADHHDE